MNLKWAGRDLTTLACCKVNQLRLAIGVEDAKKVDHIGTLRDDTKEIFLKSRSSP